MKNFFLGVLTVLVIGAVGIGSYLLGKDKGSNTTPQPSPTIAAITVAPTPETINTGIPTQEDIEEEIKQALIKKNKWPGELMITVKINKREGIYTSGSVSITEKNNPHSSGGYFFAIKQNGVWMIVADGNGTISCGSLVPYPNYPNSFIPECWDESTGKTVKR